MMAISKLALFDQEAAATIKLMDGSQFVYQESCAFTRSLCQNLELPLELTLK